MKRIFSIGLVLLAAVLLVACNTRIRESDPVIRGVRAEVEIDLGEEYNPLDGVTAFESDASNAKEITSDLVTTFNETWLTRVGEYDFTISVTNSQNRTKTENVKLIVGSRSQVTLVSPAAVTYYIGSTPFDPLEEVRAYKIGDSGTPEDVEVVVTNAEYTTAVPGTYSYTVEAGAEEGVPVIRTIKLTVRASANIPNELPNELITVELWHSNGTTIENKLLEYEKTFETMMAGLGYNVDVVITKNGSTYDELRTNVINALKGGTLPNIVQNYPDHVVEYASNGVIASLTPYIKHPVWGLDESKDNEKFTDILESYRAEQRATNDNGDYLSLPFNKSTEVVAYNKTLFDAVLAPGQPFPETWEELFDLYPAIMQQKDNLIDVVAERWTAAGNPLAADDIQKAKDNFVPFSYDSSANGFITLTRQFGGSYTSRGSDGKGRLEFDSTAVRNMLKFFATKTNGQEIFTVPARWEAGYSNEVSLKGFNAFSVGSTGGIRYNTPVENGFKLYDIGVAPVPYSLYFPESRAVIQQGTNMSLTTQGTAAQKVVSWLFIKYLMSEEIQSDFGIATGYSPVRNSVYDSNQAYIDYLKLADTEMGESASAMGLTVKEYGDLFELKVKAMGNLAAAQQREYQFYDTPFIGSSAARDAVGVAFDRVILHTNMTTLDEAINNAIQYAIDEANKVIS